MPPHEGELLVALPTPVPGRNAAPMLGATALRIQTGHERPHLILPHNCPARSTAENVVCQESNSQNLKPTLKPGSNRKQDGHLSSCAAKASGRLVETGQ